MIGVVLVTYNSEKDIEKCLASVFRQVEDVRVCVVDNASADGTVGVLKGKFSKVELIENFENVGFAKAVNMGVSLLRAKLGNFDQREQRDLSTSVEMTKREVEMTKKERKKILLLNPDSEMEDGALAEMLKVMEDQDCAVVQPVITKMSNSEEVMTCGNEYCGMGLVMRGGEGLKIQNLKVKNKKIEYASGTCLLVRSDVWEELRGFDEEYFLYYEDTDFSSRARKAGHELWLAADARVRHADHSRLTWKRLKPYVKGWWRFTRTERG